MSQDLGPLKTLLQDADVTEVMVNAWDRLFIEKSGRMEPVPIKFVDARALEELVQALLFSQGKDSSKSLLFDGALPGGLRYNITLPPLSPLGPTITIRKHGAATSTLENLVRRKMLSPKAAAFLSACVRGRISMILSGGTGTGKTTLLNALASLIPEGERLVTIEDTAELQIRHANWIRLESVKEGPAKVSVRECVANSLRMRPDRIIVGECRGAEAADMMQAMNTGHEGSLTTLHANSSSDALARLETMVMSSGLELPVRTWRRNIAEAVDLVVQIKRSKAGVRYVSDIIEITGMESEVITRATIFQIPEGRVSGEELRSTGLVPEFLKRLDERDVKFPAKFFDPNQQVAF